jgi:CRISPR/Cas system-associated protein Csm6
VIFPEGQPAADVVGHLRVLLEALLRQRAQLGNATSQEVAVLEHLDEARTWAEAEAIGAADRGAGDEEGSMRCLGA